MNSAKYITEPRTFTVEGLTVTCNIRFREWGRVGGKPSYSVSQAEVGKVIKALAKEAGFNVLWVRSESFAGGDSVDITVESELTPEQIASNKNVTEQYRTCYHPDYIHEPRGELLKSIARHFRSGDFNGSEDLYEYRQNGPVVKDPSGDEISFDTKYTSEYFDSKK